MVGQAEQNTKIRAPTDPQEDERAVRQRQKMTDTDIQQDRVLKVDEEEEKKI
jgi:hypothetical protein